MNYDWSRSNEKHIENGATQRMEYYGLTRKSRQKVIEETKKSMDRQMRKVKAVYDKMTEEDKEKVEVIINDTETIEKPREKLQARREKLYPFYKKYVDPSSKLKGCGSCIQAQSKFFELLVRYKKEYEQESQ